MNLKNRTLFIADNLDIMRGIDSESVDLIYLDPPFNKKKRFKAPIGSPAEGAEFKDIWTDEDVKDEWRGEIAAQHQDLYEIIKAAETVYDRSMAIYMTAMSIRLFEMKRILKQTGSIYLHCDQTASHYLKICMDSVFGKNNFRNEIIWGYEKPRSSKKQFRKNHDTILYYSKTGEWKFHPQRVPLMDGTFKLRKPFKRPDGSIWEPKEPGKQAADWWYDIPSFSTRMSAKERTGWPTQKPLKLLDRIIKASSNPGDFVLDPFCGCATACVAAELLGRRWVGIDIAPAAEVITKLRLDEARHNLESTIAFDPMEAVAVLTEPPKRTDVKTPKPADFKPELYSKQNGQCNGCAVHFPYRNMTIDHIQPQSKGGTDDAENLQLLCHACNSTKSTGTQEELVMKLRERGVIE